MDPPDPIVPLSALIRVPPEVCRERGLRSWLSIALTQPNAIQTILALREISGIGLGDAKVLCGGVAASPSGMDEVIARLENGDVTNAARLLQRHYHLGTHAPLDPHAPTRLALALARAFGLPVRETEADVVPPREMEGFASAIGWSPDETRERGFAEWLLAMTPEDPSLSVVIAVREATGLAARSAFHLLRALRSDPALAGDAIETPESALEELEIELSARAECEREETRDLLRVLRVAFR